LLQVVARLSAGVHPVNRRTTMQVCGRARLPMKIRKLPGFVRLGWPISPCRWRGGARSLALGNV